MDKSINNMNSVTMGHVNHKQVYSQKMYDSCFDLFDLCRSADGRLLIDSIDIYYDILGDMFYFRENLAVAVKYHKLAYESCLRSPTTCDHTRLPCRKKRYLDSKSEFDKLPPLRFAVGSEVEFMYTPATGSDGVSGWRLGRVVEQYYHERSFDMNFAAPYRLQLLEDSESTDQPPVYAWVKADIDRYVRKVGVRSIEDTRYQVRLDAKVSELARVYCSREFIEDIYLTLAQDREFVDMLLSVWHVNLSEPMLYLYRMLVMYSQPLDRTGSGYHVPSTEEVIAGIRAYFEPAGSFLPHSALDIISDTRHSNTKRTKAYITVIMHQLSQQGIHCDETSHFPDSNTSNEAALARAFTHYIDMYRDRETKQFAIDISTLIGSGFSVPIPPQYRTAALNDLMSKVKNSNNLFLMDANAVSAGGVAVPELYAMWLAILLELELSESIYDYPWIYFFIKYCLDQGLGVPKLALSEYDRMNMQLSREFIRCANYSCKLNKLDQSSGQVKFKQCSRCKAVIYCSRECQTAHYPVHKRLCTEHLTDQEES